MPSREELRARVGSTVDAQWRLDALIGVGGMAAVYAATHQSGRRAAFKILHREHAHNHEVRARFFAEHDLARASDHPDRLEILGLATTDDGLPVLVMELLEGETLAAAQRRLRRLSPRRALTIVRALLEQLAACHERGVVHRDLKPENIFLTHDGRVKLLDFGVARGARAITRRRVAIGTPEFMAPEQARGQTTLVDARSDVFAVGAILWSLLTGYPLRGARTEDDALRAAAHDPVRTLAMVAPELPPPLCALVDRALALAPEERFADARELLNAVDAVLAEVAHEPSGEVELDTEDRPTIPSTPSSLRTVA